MPKKVKKNYTHARGRRKLASARVRLFKGEGDSMVNGMLIGKYFEGDRAKREWMKPFEATGVVGKYFFTTKVSGGGKNGQLSAVTLAVARSLVSLNSEKHRVSLKKAGLLTRDPRNRERRKIGTGGKARRAKQSPKR